MKAPLDTHISPPRPMGNAEVMDESARVQLCGTFAVELLGRRVDNMLPGRQGRLLFAYLALSRLRPVSRNSLIDALWGDAARRRWRRLGADLQNQAVVGGACFAGVATDLGAPEPAHVDVEVALSACTPRSLPSLLVPGNGPGHRPWAPCLSHSGHSCPRLRRHGRRRGVVASPMSGCAHSVLRENLSGTWGAELPAAERAARELVDAAPFRESGHLLLMRALAASGNVAEALAAYERLRILLRDELGADRARPAGRVHPPPRLAHPKLSPMLCQRGDNDAGECFHYDNYKQSKQSPVSRR